MINNILYNTLIAITNKFDSNNPLTFIAQTANSTIKLTKNREPVIDGLQYRTNINSDWSTYTIDTVIKLTNVDDYVQFQNTKNQLSLDRDNYVLFVMTGKIAAYGNIQSMLKDSTSCTPYCYRYMFKDCTSLTVAPTLLATTLAEHCYLDMFYGCTSLTAAPTLPATNLATNCYFGMFKYCTSLTSAPTLPATNLATGCYSNMFNGCSSLTSAPALPATTVDWGCYAYMFKNCTSLTVAPELPATKLVEHCYDSMFEGCAKLNYVKVKFTDWKIKGRIWSTGDWLLNVSTTGTFVCPSTLPILRTDVGCSGIPEEWTVETF